MVDESRQWHHSPCHIFMPGVPHIVTARTLEEKLLFRGRKRLRLLQEALLKTLHDYRWRAQAWAIFPNHYHFVALAPEKGKDLKTVVQRLHSQTARELNEMDDVQGRPVWFQYRDTCLTYEGSYFARLNYVHNNAVRHGVVPVAENYEFCSAGWFKMSADDSFRRKVESYRYDRVNVDDDFEVPSEC